MTLSSPALDRSEPQAARELLADAAPKNSQHMVASFTKLFERRGARSLWEKITHTLMMPLRRYWARQQVGKVLHVAQQHESTAKLPAVRDLRAEFNSGGRINTQTARNAAIEMMLSGVQPSKAWGDLLNNHLNEIATWCATLQIAGKPIFTDKDKHSVAWQGLSILIDFARHPGCAVCDTERKAVLAFKEKIYGKDLNHKDEHAVALNVRLDQIFKTYENAFNDDRRRVDKSAGRLQTPTQRRTTAERDQQAFDLLKTSPEFGSNPGLIDAFANFVQAFRAGDEHQMHILSNTDDLRAFLKNFPDSFARESGALAELQHIAIALADARLKIKSKIADPTTDVLQNDQYSPIFLALQQAGVSRTCMNSLAKYIENHQHPEDLALFMSARNWMELDYLQKNLPSLETLGMSPDQTRTFSEILEKIKSQIKKTKEEEIKIQQGFAALRSRSLAKPQHSIKLGLASFQ